MGMRTVLPLKASDGIWVVQQDIGVKYVVFHCGRSAFFRLDMRACHSCKARVNGRHLVMA